MGAGRKGYEFRPGDRNHEKEAIRYRCQGCGKRVPRKKFQTHHFFVQAAEASSRNLNPQVIKDPWNMAHLCDDCHHILHEQEQVRSEEVIQRGYALLEYAFRIRELQRRRLQRIYDLKYRLGRPEIRIPETLLMRR